MFKREKLVQARKIKGFSADDVIYALSQIGRRYSTQTIYNWEKGRREPRVSDLVALADVLEQPLGYFFAGDIKLSAKQKNEEEE